MSRKGIDLANVLKQSQYLPVLISIQDIRLIHQWEMTTTRKQQVASLRTSDYSRFSPLCFEVKPTAWLQVYGHSGLQYLSYRQKTVPKTRWKNSKVQKLCFPQYPQTPINSGPIFITPFCVRVIGRTLALRDVGDGLIFSASRTVGRLTTRGPRALREYTVLAFHSKQLIRHAVI